MGIHSDPLPLDRLSQFGKDDYCPLCGQNDANENLVLAEGQVGRREQRSVFWLHRECFDKRSTPSMR